MTDVDLFSAFHFESTVLHDAIFMTDAGADVDRNEILVGHFHGLDGPFVDVGADDSVAMAGVDKHVGRWDFEILLNLPAHFAQVLVVKDGTWSVLLAGSAEGKENDLGWCQKLSSAQ